MTINTNSGSFFPNKAILDLQFNPPEDELHFSQIQSKIFKAIPLWENAYQDLTRLELLIIKGTVIYVNARISADEAHNWVFQQIETHLGSTALAVRAAHLFEQHLGGKVLIEVGKAKKIFTGTDDNPSATHVLSAQRTATILNAGKKEFKMIHEELVQQMSLDDFSKTYFKVKTIVEGPLAALETKNTDRLTISTVYTKERPTVAKALKEDYLGTRVGGLFNTESYLNASGSI